MSVNKFVHLHVHSEYSLLDGLSKIKPLLGHVQELGMDQLALTDHGVMYGAIEFYKKAKDLGVKPIIGMEAYTTNIDLHERPDRSKVRNYHLLLLAKNKQGYDNLMKLTSIAHMEGYYYRPRIDKETLQKYSKGLICTSACPAGELAEAFREDDYKKAKKVASWFAEVFGDDYYLEVQRHKYERFLADATHPDIRRELQSQIEYEKQINDGVIKLSRDLGLPIVATNDAHYIKQADARAQDALVCIATGKNVEDTKRLRFIDAPDYYIKSPEEMAELYPDLPDALENTVKAADKCDIELVLGKWFFPQIELPKGKTAPRFLTELVEKGMKEKYTKVSKELKDRVVYELKIIIDRGYAPYFLIYWDMSNWARINHVPINTRGSVAGSVVSYVLGITIVDPIRYNLPFERFLNPFRPSPPDIDMDISDRRRGDMLDYLSTKYGKEKVAQICTFGRMLARASVRDVARVLGYPYSVGDRLAKATPVGSQGFPMTIARALEESVELKQMYDTDPDAKKVIDLAKQVEGNARHTSVHAAGVVVAPSEITDFSPIQLDPSNNEKTITQYEMHASEDVGLVKLDVLGIRNLAILEGAVQLVKKIQGEQVELHTIPLDDKKTFDMLGKGQTMGTFQLNGSGMTKYLVELQPERIEDIMAMIALYRPGPISNIPDYIARKKGKQKITYYHPKMENFLDKSYGILVYQDDLLFTALELAGYNWESVDTFRKAVGKKIPEEMAKQHVIFVEGCMQHSDMTKEEAEGLWKLFEPFQGYGFNKAHAASYGMVSYQTSYMKANYPVCYMCSLLTAESNDTDKIAQAISECRELGITVLPPDINESEIDFTVVPAEGSLENLGIRFGLSAIKNVGNAAISAILEARDESEFVSFADLLARVDGRKVNKKVLESLIKVGALSKFGNRAALIASLDELRAKVAKPKGAENQQDLFSTDDIKQSAQSHQVEFLDNLPEFDKEQLETLERELLGFSLTSKPIKEKIGDLAGLATHRVFDLFEESQRKAIRVAALVSSVRVIFTKKSNQEMAFVKVLDDTGEIELVVFPSTYASTRSFWVENRPLLIHGTVDERDEGVSVIVESVQADTVSKPVGGRGRTTVGTTDKLFVRVPATTTMDQLKAFRTLISRFPGNQPVTLIFEGKNGQKMDLPFKVNWTPELASSIASIFNN